MNALKITDSEIEAYLLGATQGDTAETIDELIFLDEDFASRVGAAERDLIDDYLRKELDAEKQRRFEGYYLGSARRRENVRLAGWFGEFVASAAPQTEHPIRAEPVEEEQRSGTVSWWKFAIPAFAAAVLAAVAVPLWFLAPSQPSQIASETTDRNVNVGSSQGQAAVSNNENIPTPIPSQPPAAAEPGNASEKPRNAPEMNNKVPAPRVFAVTLVPQTRSSSGERQIFVPSGTDRVAVTIKLEPTDFARVRVILTNEASGTVVWQGTVRPSGIAAGYQSARLSIPARSLPPGRYRFTASGTGGDTEIIGDYPFQLMP